MEKKNSFEILKDILSDTYKRRIRWVCTNETEWKSTFKYKKKTTDKKFLLFIISSQREKYKSDLTILYGDKDNQTLVSVITPQYQPALYDLIDHLNGEYLRGEIDYIKESSNSMREEDRTEKLKNLRLISMITKDTQLGKLIWENTYHEKRFAQFVTTIALTKLKKLTINVKSCPDSEISEDNQLRVMLKTEQQLSDQRLIGSSNTNVIKRLSLKEYPAMIPLFKILNKTYLGRDFTSPFIEEPSNRDLEKHRKKVMMDIREIMKKMPNSSAHWEDIWSEIYEAYEECKKATSVSHLNRLLSKAQTEFGRIAIGTPRWAR